MTRWWKRPALWLVAASFAATGFAPTPPPTPAQGYYGIGPGHDFPAAEATLEAARTNQDVHAQRTHVWNIFAGATAPTPDGKYARWETWYSEDETFADGPAAQSLGPHRIQRRFRIPNQFRTTTGAAPQAAGTGLLSFVLFNFETYQHIRQTGLYHQAVFDSFAKTGAPDRNITNNKTIPEFPNQAMSLKLIWWPVAYDQVTAMPIWDGDPNPAVTTPKPFTTWPRAVAIAPTGTPAPNATATVKLGTKTYPNSHLVGLSAFHVITLDATLAAQINSDPQLSGLGNSVMGHAFRAGDHVVLAAMHMTTKEIKDWVWATFWWHDRADVGPFAADRPAAVTGVWRNYLMAASYDLNTPKASDGGPHDAFNPWLEARFPNGVHSNCMACHERSGNNGTPFLPVTRGNPQPSDSAFKAGTVRADFLWSIPDNAH